MAETLTATLTDAQIKDIEKLSGVLTREQIADYLEIDRVDFAEMAGVDGRLNKAFLKSRAVAIAVTAKALIKSAQNGSVAAQKFYLQTQAGWSEVEKQPHQADIFDDVAPAGNGRHDTDNQVDDIRKAILNDFTE